MPELPPGRVASSTDKGHGRREKRTLRTTTILTKHQDWAGLQQGFELTRERTVQGTTTVETVYGITSLAPERADARRLLSLDREHWWIENGLHSKRDVTLGEDQSRIRTGVAPTMAAAVRTLNNCLPQALSLLGIPQGE